MAVRARFSGTAFKIDGVNATVAPLAEVMLYEANSSDPLAVTVYKNLEGTDPGDIYSLPFNADPNGNYEFYLAAPQRVKIVTSIPGSGDLINDNEGVFGDPSEFQLLSQAIRVPDLIGDDSADDTLALTDALNGSGVTLLQKPAVAYKITDTLIVGNGVPENTSSMQSLLLYGGGHVDQSTTESTEFGLQGWTIIRWHGATDGLMMQIRGPLTNLRIDGIGFDCNDTAGYAIETYDVQASMISNIKAIKYRGGVIKLLAYAYSDATPPSALRSGNGGNQAVLFNVYGWSMLTTGTIGIVVGSDQVEDSSGSVLGGAPPDVGPDIARSVIMNCTIRADDGTPGGAANSTGIQFRFCDGITVAFCTLACETPWRYTPPTGDTNFPNAISFYNCTSDNGAGSGGDIKIDGTWTPWSGVDYDVFPEAFFAPPPAAPNTINPLLPTHAHMWGRTYQGGHLGTQQFKDAVKIWDTLEVAAAITADTTITAVSSIASATGDITAANDMKFGQKLHIGNGNQYMQAIADAQSVTNDTSGSNTNTIDLGTRFGVLTVTNRSGVATCRFNLNGGGHTVTFDSVTTSGFATSNAGSDVIAVYWDSGTSKYRVRNRYSGARVLDIRFEGTDS